MKTVLLFAALCIGAVSPIFAQSPTAGSGSAVLQPKIIVVPFTRENESVRHIVDNNSMVSQSVSKIKGMFDVRGFTTYDFVARLKAGKTQDLLRAGSQSDEKSKVITETGADIYVEVRTEVNKNSNGSSEVVVTLQAYETLSGASLANQSYNSGFYQTSDSTSLSAKAIARIGDDFFSILQDKFIDIAENGRTVSLQVLISENNQEMDLDSKVGPNNTRFSRAMEAWCEENAFNNSYEMNISDKIMNITIKFPLRDQNTGKAYPLSKIRGTLLDFFDSLSLDTSITLVSGVLVVTIK